MRKFIVTVKLPKAPFHDPRNKVAGACPVSGLHCTDTTGEHHSVLVEAESSQAVFETYRAREIHVTRVEEIQVESAHGGDHMDFRGAVIGGSFVGKVVG